MPDLKQRGNKIFVHLSPGGINIRILVFAALVGLTALALRPLQLRLQNQIEELKNELIGRAEEFWGRRVRYGSMGPSIFGTMDIRDVLVLRGDDSVFLDVSRLRFSFSLFELLRGNIHSAFKSVRIDRPILNLDFEKDADLGEKLASYRVTRGSFRNGSSSRNDPADNGAGDTNGTGSPGDTVVEKILDFIPEDFSLRIWNGEWDLSGQAGAVRLRGVQSTVLVRENRVSFQGRWNAEARLEGGNGLDALLAAADSPALDLLMAGRVNGEYLADMEEGSATVTIPSLSGDFFRLKPVSVSFFLSGSRLEIRKTYDRSPVTFAFIYDMKERGFHGRFEGENFSPESLLVFSGAWADYNPWLTLKISGAADFERESSGEHRFAVDFSGAGPERSFLERALLDIDVYGNNEFITIDEFDIRSPFGNLAFQGGVAINPDEYVPAAPHGVLSLANFRLRGNRGLSGTIALASSGTETSLTSDNLTAGDMSFPGLAISLNWEREALAFAASVFSAGGSGFYNGAGTASPPDSLAADSFSVEGSVDYDFSKSHANFRLDSFSAGGMLSLVEPFVSLPSFPSPARAAVNGLSVTTEVFVSTDDRQVLYNAPLISLSYGDAWNNLAAVSVSGTSRGVEFYNGRVTWKEETADINGSVDYADANDISFNLDVTIRDLTYFFNGIIQDKRNVNIRGAYGFQVYMNTGDDGVYSGYATGDAIPIPSGEGLASLSYFFSVSYDSPSSWRAEVENFQLAGLSTPVSSSALLRFSGTADENGMAIPDLFYDDGRGALAGDISCDWDSTFENLSFRTDISGSSNDEYYGFDGEYRNKILELSVSGRNMQFSRFTPHNVVAGVSATLSWESIRSFDAEVQIPSLVFYRGSGRQNDAVRVSVNLSADDEVFLADGLKINYSDVEMSVPYIRVNRSEAMAETEGRIWGFFAEKPLNISMRGNARFNNSPTWADLIQRFEYLDGSLTMDNASFDTMKAEEPFSFVFNSRRDESGYVVDLSGGPRNMLRLKYASEAAESGILYAALSAPSPVRGTITASIDSGILDAQGTDLYADLGSLWRFVPPTDVISFPAGFVTASVRAAGPLDAPAFYGTARGDSVQILVPEYLPEPIRPEPVTVLLNGSEMTFGPVDAILGQGWGTVSGWFRFDQWIPNIFNIDIQVAEEHSIPYDLDISGLFASGLAWGKMTLAMENMILSVTGDLTAQETEISVDTANFSPGESTLSSGEDDDEVAVIADLSINAGRRVEFFWPSADFPVIQAYAGMGTGVSITSDGFSGAFNLTGNVQLRGGEIFYLERNFYIREGTLFLRESETQFDPRISARAEIREQSDVGPVIISMIIDNAPLRSFSPRFTSAPPLSQLEIYSLLGEVPQTEGAQRNLATSVAIDSVAQFTIINRFQRQVRNFLGLDMLSFRTQLLQNLISRVSGGEWLNSSNGSQYRIGNYFDNSTVFFGKYLGADIFIQGMIPMKYDENQTGWGGLVLEPELGLEMRNPLFDIRLNMTPRNLENFFVDDLSLSLIYRKTF